MQHSKQAPNQSEECLIRFPGWERATTSVKKLSRKSAQSLGSQWSQFLTKKAKYKIKIRKCVCRAKALKDNGVMAILKLLLIYDPKFLAKLYVFVTGPYN